MLLLLFTDNTNDLSLRNNVAREECRNAKNAKIYPEVSEITLCNFLHTFETSDIPMSFILFEPEFSVKFEEGLYWIQYDQPIRARQCLSNLK